MSERLIKTGLIGTAISLLCCFTPVLVIVLGALGLSALLGWVDYIVPPAIGIFALILAYGLISKWRARGAANA